MLYNFQRFTTLKKYLYSSVEHNIKYNIFNQTQCNENDKYNICIIGINYFTTILCIDNTNFYTYRQLTV